MEMLFCEWLELAVLQTIDKCSFVSVEDSLFKICQLASDNLTCILVD